MIKLGVIYGGISTEHDVSEMSAKSVIENLNKEKYDINMENGMKLKMENKKKFIIYYGL